MEIGGRHRLITLCHLGNLRITQKRISKSCASGAISGRLSKASSSRFKTVLNSLGMGTPLSRSGFAGHLMQYPNTPFFFYIGPI